MTALESGSDRPAWSPRAKVLLMRWQREEYARIGVPEPDLKALIPAAIERLAALSGFAPGSPEYKALRARVESEMRFDDLPTPLENPNWYRLALLHVADVETAIRGRAESIPARPLIGSVPSGIASAIAVHIRSTGENLLVFSSGLFLYLNLMAKLAAQCAHAAVLATPPGQGLDQRALPLILGAPDLRAKLADALYAYVVLGNASAAPQYLLDGNVQATASTLRDAMELFVVAHEYGHILAGHHHERPPADNTTADAGNPETVRWPEPRWAEEIEADERGLDLLMEVVQRKGMNPVQSLAAVHLFFLSLELADRLVNFLMAPHDEQAAMWAFLTESLPGAGEGGRAGDEHPGPGLRRIHLRHRIETQYPEHVKNGANEMAEDLRAMLHHLWRATAPAWIARRRRGDRPCPLWDPRAAGTDGSALSL